MKKRHIPALERLEVRETPDVSLGSAAAAPVMPAAADSSAVGFDGDRILQPLPGAADAAQVTSTHVDLDALLSPADDALKGVLSSQGVKTFFANAEEVDRLLGDSARLLEEPKSAQQTHRPPNVVSAEPDGWQFLYNYTLKAIRKAERTYGTLPDHDDLVHEVFVDWREQVGPSHKAFADLLNPDSAERSILRQSVRRVIDHARYEQVRGRRTVELFDQPASADASEQDWLDLKIDWSLGVGRPGPRERQLLDLRRQGMTFEEIGSELGLLKQRVCEIYNSTIRKLQDVYS